MPSRCRVVGITILPFSAERLEITGDVTLALRVPFDADEDRIRLAFSDGTALIGRYVPEVDDWHWEGERKGTAGVIVTLGIVSADPMPEWVEVSVHGGQDAAERTYLRSS